MKKLKAKNDSSKVTKDVPSISFFTLYRFASGKDKLFIACALLFSVICSIFNPISILLFASLLQAMVDYGKSKVDLNPQPDAFMDAVTKFAIYYSTVGIFVIVLTYTATTIMNIAAYNQVYKIRLEYFKAAMNQDFGYFDLHQTGDFASKMTDDVVKLEEGIGEKLATFVYYQATFVSLVVMAMTKGWKLALICLITFPATLVLFCMAELFTAKFAKKEAEAVGHAASVAEEVFSAIRTVYAFSGQQTEILRYQKHLEAARKINIKKALINGIALGLLFFCIFGSYALSFWFGYRFMMDDPEHYDVDTMISVFFGVLMGSLNFGASTSVMEVFGTAKGAGAQIFHLIDNVPTINPLLNQGVVPDSIRGDIEFSDVKFHYPSRPDVPVLEKVTLNIKRGQSVALVGHSGSGKSTIIHLISRNYDVVDGSVTLDGRDVRELSVRWLRSQVGLVGQEPVLFNTSVRENIRHGRQNATNEEIEKAARNANAHNFIMKLPNGYDTLVGERGASLSGGQKQRVAIARALVRDPRVLLLDEATSALDTASESKVQRALDMAQKGRTTIIVAHRLSTIRNVDLIFVFKSGKVVESGTHEELMRKKGQYHDMVRRQTSPDESESKKREKIISKDISEKDEDTDENSVEETEKEEEVVPKEAFWRVVKLNSPEWKSITIASVSSIFTGCGIPLLAIILGDFIGNLNNPDLAKREAKVKEYVFIFLGIGAATGLANFIQIFFYGIAGEYLTERLRRLMFGKFLEQEVAFYDDRNNSTGALSARLSGEAAAVQGATGQRIGTVIQAAGTFSIALILALIYEWRVGLVALTFVPIMGILLYKQGRMITAESFGTAKTMEQSSKIAVEAVANVRTVASLGQEARFLQVYADQLLPAVKLANRSAHWRGVVFGLTRGVFFLVYAVAMLCGGYLIVKDGINYEVVIMSAQALIMGVQQSAQAFAFTPNFQKGIRAASRVIVMLNRQSKIADPEKPAFKEFRGSGQASFRMVKFNYPTRPSIQVLKGLDLEIYQGKTVALVGESGCGKSTVIQMLERYYDPNEGVVSQDGISLEELRLRDCRQTIGLVQQEPILFDRTISDNISYGDNSRIPNMDEIVEAAKQANIHNFITSLPLGYETNIGSKGTQLSVGQKQRVAIARALIRKPKMLLLDEATSALDTESEKVVQEALDKAKTGRTCIMIAHRLSTIRDADVICVLHQGRVAEHGTHQELMNLNGIYYALNQRGSS